MLEAMVARLGPRRGRPRLSDVAVTLSRGRTVLLGPNGAGKTTLLRALAGVHRFEGSLRLDGSALDPRRPRPAVYRRAVGWLPQEVVPFPSLTVREHVAYVGWLKGLRAGPAWDRALDSLTQVGLEARADDRAERLSGGQLRRLGIAAVLVHEAQYVLLDEPTAGLDPRERDRLVEALRSIETRCCVLVSTHDTGALLEAGANVMVLRQGTVSFAGSYESFVGSAGAGAGANAGAAAEAPEELLRRAYAALVPEE